MAQIYNSLADLDELLLACRDQRAKDYLFEAIASYKASAYRSAIVATWVAVCFDFIEKIHELALAGDKEAEKLSIDINDARLREDLSWTLKFEKTILESARDKFELISPLEYTDLRRLQDDRNRCAHPSLVSDGEPFIPSAELARLHIRSAVTHFLQHPPVQGKAAMDRLLTEVESNYFPTEVKKAVITFANGPLKRPRKSLVANFAVVLFKRIVDKDTDWQLRMRLTSAFKAVHALHEVAFNEALEEKLSKLFRNVKDNCLQLALHLITDVPHLWTLLEPDTQQRLQIYTENVPNDELDVLELLLDFTPLKKLAEHRIFIAPAEELMKATWFMPPKQAVVKYVDAYIKSKNFDQANKLAKELRSCAPLLDKHQIEKIIAGAANNGEVSFSFGFPVLLTGILKAREISKDDFEKLLIENSLEQFIPISED